MSSKKQLLRRSRRAVLGLGIFFFVVFPAFSDFVYLQVELHARAGKTWLRSSKDEIVLEAGKAKFLKRHVHILGASGEVLSGDVVLRFEGRLGMDGRLTVDLRARIQKLLHHTAKEGRSLVPVSWKRTFVISPGTLALAEIFSYRTKKETLRLGLTLGFRLPGEAESEVYALTHASPDESLFYRYRIQLLRFTLQGKKYSEAPVELWGRSGEKTLYEYGENAPLSKTQGPAESFRLHIMPTQVANRSLVHLESAGKIRTEKGELIAIQKSDSFILHGERSRVLDCSTSRKGRRVGYEIRIDLSEESAKVFDLNAGEASP